MNIKNITKTESKRLLKYYEKAGPDYKHWSDNFNMHFGYYENGINPFNREMLLENMNRRVLKELNPTDSRDAILLDLGCGLGATLRFAGKYLPLTKLKGVTIVPWQVEKAIEINNKDEQNETIQIIEGDYCCTHFADNSIDNIIAIESSCYASGASKAPLLKEAHRILKPGGRFVFADGFRKRHQPLKGLIKMAYKSLCDSWVLEQLGNINEFEKCLRTLSFKQIQITDISWNVAPSVAHVPGTVTTFLIKQLLRGNSDMTKERWDNLKSPLLTILVGLARKDFGYYIISGTK